MPLNLVSTSVSTPPPVGGWDTRESLADMPETHAVILSNFFPETDVVRVRRGNTSHATGMSGEVQSLIEYVPKSGTGALFAANAGNIYDVTSAGAGGGRRPSRFAPRVPVHRVVGVLAEIRAALAGQKVHRPDTTDDQSTSGDRSH